MKYIFTLVLLMGLISCINSQKKGYTSPAGYDLNNPETDVLPAELSEISGIAFHAPDNDSLYAIQDELGNIYHYKTGTDQIQSFKFGKKGDYEDLAIYKNTAIVLRSDGKLFSIPLAQLKGPEVLSVKEWEGLLPKGEYESLFADEKLQELVVLCKECKGDKKEEIVSGYRFAIIGDSISPKGTFRFDATQLAQYIPSKKYIVFKPSAIAKHPLTGEWYILSSVNKLLVVADAAWNARQVHELDPAKYEQPEGMAFDTNGNLYISSEAGETESGTVMKFIYKRPG